MMEKIVAHKKSEKAVGDTKKSSARKFTLSSTSHEHIQQLHSSVGNQVVRQLCEQGLIQAKHKISKPNDIYEREADAAAEKVAKGMPVVQVSGLPENGLSQSQEFQPQYNKNETIQSSETRHHPKKVINEIHESITQQEEESEELEEEPPQTQGSVKIQRKLPEAQESSINLNAAIRAMAQSGEGNPLNQDVKQRTEKLFNADFSNVRVHKDYHANMAAKAISARAFTQGTDIYLSSNEST